MDLIFTLAVVRLAVEALTEALVVAEDSVGEVDLVAEDSAAEEVEVFLAVAPRGDGNGRLG